MLSLLLNYLKHRKQNDESPKFNLLDPKEIPYVTIQLPLYNEKYVVPRLLENIAKLEYPRTKLEIQVLDDSTDESVAETAEIIKNLQATARNRLIRFFMRYLWQPIKQDSHLQRWRWKRQEWEF